jgi:hypothetical protein
MAFAIRKDNVNKVLVPCFPSTEVVGSTENHVGDLVYRSTINGGYVAVTSAEGTSNGRILGILQIKSTLGDGAGWNVSSTNYPNGLGYIAPIRGEVLEADWSTVALSSNLSTNIGKTFRLELHPTLGTVVDLSTAPVYATLYSSEIGASTSAYCFVLTGFDTSRRKAYGYVPNQFLEI